MMIGTLAITGVGIPLTNIGFAGFLSKDAVIESAHAGGTAYAFWLLIAAAAMTSFYSWRLMFMTFFGYARGDIHTHDHAHESPWTMLVPLGVLAVGATFAGMVWYNSFFGDYEKMQAFFGIPVAEAQEAEAVAGDVAATEAVATTEATAEATGAEAIAPNTQIAGEGAIFYSPDNHVIEEAHEGPKWVKLAPFIAMLAGFLLAYQMYIRRPDLPAKLAANQRPLYNFLLNKWYFDEIYDFLIVKPLFALGRFLWRRGDGDVIDGGINGVAMGIVPLLTRLAGRAQSGFLYHYVIAMVLGITIILTWVTMTGGAN